MATAATQFAAVIISRFGVSVPVDGAMVAQLGALLNDPVDVDKLAGFLIANSNLPGPRGNLELIDRCANVCVGRSDLIPMFEQWLDLQTAKDDPAEFLSATAAVSLGAIATQTGEVDRTRAIARLRAAANDPRWRVREGVAMGLQRIGEASFAAFSAILRAWLPDATLLERRAIAAALAHPPILKRPAQADEALAIVEPIALSIVRFDAAMRKTEQFQVLKQGLSYALSVLVAPAPERGFALLQAMIGTGDRDAIGIVTANLGKARIAKPFPAEIARLQHAISHRTEPTR